MYALSVGSARMLAPRSRADLHFQLLRYKIDKCDYLWMFESAHVLIGMSCGFLGEGSDSNITVL